MVQRFNKVMTNDTRELLNAKDMIQVLSVDTISWKHFQLKLCSRGGPGRI